MKKWAILDRLVDVILSNVEGCIVEIGIGQSTKILSAHASKYKRTCYSCDISKDKCDWARLLGGVNVFEGRSIDFLKRFPAVPIASAFIDGNHSYSTVAWEVDSILPKLASGGVIFLHDTLPQNWEDVHGYTESNRFTGDVYLARQALEQRRDLQVFTWPYTAGDVGLTMIMQKEKSPPVFRV